MTLCDAQDPWGASWAADDRIVFGQGQAGIFRVPSTGGTKELLISVDSEKNESAHGPQILPGGEAVLFTLRSGSRWDDAQIVVQSLETGERKVIVNGGTDARYAPTGHLVYAHEGKLLAVPFDVVRLEVNGGLVPIVEGIRQALSNFTGAAQFAFSDQGSLVYVPGGAEVRRTLVWVDRAGEEQTVAAEPQPYFHPMLSPDGSRLATTIVSTNNEDVWIYELAYETTTRLTYDPASDRRLLWTPDGKRVVFTSDRDGEGNLYSTAADGTGQVERLTTSPNLQYPYSFSPDGKKLVFIQLNSESNFDVHVLSMENERTGQALLQEPFNEISPAISPDGHWMAYVSDESGRNEVYVRPFPDVDTGKWQISNGGGESPLWAPNGRELFYRNGETMMVVPIKTEPIFTRRIPEVLFTGTYFSSTGRTYDISPDGQRLLMIKEGDQTEGASERQELIVVFNWFEELKRLVPTE